MQRVNNFDSIIFDLDGTLWDSSASCEVAWNNVLKRNQIEYRKITADDVRKVAGKPHEICIRETFLGLPEAAIQTLIHDTTLEDNLMVAKLGGLIFDGVGVGLRELKKNYPLFIVSNCQSGYIETFLDFSGFQPLFTDFECWGNTDKPKSANVQSVIARNNLKSAVYIGDTAGDLKAARDNKIPFFYAEYGFSQVQDCDFKFSKFSDLVKHILHSN